MATQFAQFMSNWASKRLGVPPDRITIDMLRAGLSNLRQTGKLQHGDAESPLGGRVHNRLKRGCNPKDDAEDHVTDAELDAYLSRVLGEQGKHNSAATV